MKTATLLLAALALAWVATLASASADTSNGSCCRCNFATDANGNTVISCPCTSKQGGKACAIDSEGCVTIGLCGFKQTQGG